MRNSRITQEKDVPFRIKELIALMKKQGTAFYQGNSSADSKGELLANYELIVPRDRMIYVDSVFEEMALVYGGVRRGYYIKSYSFSAESDGFIYSFYGHKSLLQFSVKVP